MVCVHGGCPSATLARDRKSTRLNSSHANISYAVFCLKKKNHFYYTYYFSAIYNLTLFLIYYYIHHLHFSSTYLLLYSMSFLYLFSLPALSLPFFFSLF